LMARPKSPVSQAETTPNQMRKRPQKMFVRVPFCTAVQPPTQSCL
jgi:hypothetical protein